MSIYYKRGLHKAADGTENMIFTALKKGGHLHPLLELIQEDENLTLEIRDNYLNIYYQGGNVAKINSATASPDIDSNYFRTHKNRKDENWDAIDRSVKKAQMLYDDGQFKQYINMVKNAMLNYWRLDTKGVEEKKTQHAICICNTHNRSDYTQLDVEYEVSTRSVFRYKGKRRTKTGQLPKPRFDLVAVRNKDHRLCVIELKKGTDSLSGGSGVQEHAESYDNTIGYNVRNKQAFVKEIQGIIEIKQTLGLLDEDVYLDTDLEPEFIFAYQHSPIDKNYSTFELQKGNFLHHQHNRTYPLDGINHAKDKKVIWLNDGEYALRD